jgi:hypothetical protein
MMSSHGPIRPFKVHPFASRFAAAQTDVAEPSEKAVYDDDDYQFGGKLGWQIKKL